jgi:hypothetical protein
MTPAELNRSVANATGESVREIARRGFVPLSTIPIERDPEDLIIDWDQFDLQRNVAVVEQPRTLLAPERR